ncbi:MAG: LysE family translocator [Pseudomonadota bacterium]
MSYAQNLWFYFVLLSGIIIVPGMDMLFVLTNSLTGGRKLGLAAVAGITAGGVVHNIFGVIFVGTVSTMPPLFFKLILVCGSLYMAWIGYGLVKSSIFVDHVAKGIAKSYWVAFRQGAITCLTNPKASAFMLAVFPNFIKLQYGNVWMQGLIMAIMTSFLQIAIYGGFALAAHHSRDALISHKNTTIWVSRLVGVFFIAVATYSLFHGFTK